MVLRACYFCGSPGGGLESHPVVPERVAGEAGDDPERVVLCPDCHAKLERVLDGVLGALDVAAADARDGGPPDLAKDTDGFSAEITFADADTAGTTDEGSRVAPDPDGEDAPDADEADDDPGDAGVDVVPGPSAESAEPSDSAGTGTTDGTDDDADADADGSLRSLGNSGTGQYRQALRLLQNREFPMPRSDLVEVMASAYDLPREECDRLVDVAVERGWLTDDGGVLRRD